MPVLITVRNTGTHTIQNILGSVYEMHYMTEDRRSEYVLWFGHCERKPLSLLEQRLETDPPLILAMRHPMENAKSKIKRAKPMDKDFKASWVGLFGLKEAHQDSFWLPVDTPDRDEYLDRIEERLGVELTRDWTPKGVFTAQNYAWQGGMTLDQAREFFRTLPFEQFGYEL